MTTRQNEVRRILSKLNGSIPDDADVSKLANIAEAAEISPGDALFPLMIALEFYRVSYEQIPESIKEASAFMLREHASALRAEADKIAEANKSQIEGTTKIVLTAVTQWLKQEMPKILHDVLEDSVAKSLDEPTKALVQRLTRATDAADKATIELKNAGKTNLKTWSVVVVAVAIFAGGMGSFAHEWIRGKLTNSMLTDEQEESIAWGQATSQVWKNIPDSTQKMIQNAALKIKNKS